MKRLMLCKVVKLLLGIFFVISINACQKKGALGIALELAGENRKELMKVLEHYKGDTLRYNAAYFLIKNMAHGYSYAAIMDEYRKEIMTHEMKRGLHDSIWLSLSMQKNTLPQQSNKFIYDAQKITTDYLINNIDEAFATWEGTPWFEQVDFRTFCEYILPYRVKNEPLSDWRNMLKEKYAPYIVDIETPEEAFVLIYNKVLTEFKKGDNLCPYSTDVLMIDKIMKGSCDDRTLYLTSILRALGIPVAYDYVTFWANFTSNGHSWVSYIRNDSTFTLTHNDKTIELYGTIDASRFYQKHHNYQTERLPYVVDSINPHCS